MADFVLVHGAWHGGWCWRYMQQALVAEGHRVYAPSMTGLGDRAHLLRPDVNLDTHIQDIAAVIETEELSDVTLIGHSYGGAVITNVADRAPDTLRALVFVDAYIAIDGNSIISADPPEMQEAIKSHIQETPNGAVLPCPPVAMYSLSTPEDAAWVARRQTPHPAATYLQRSQLSGAWHKVPHLAYITTERFGDDGFRKISATLADDPAFKRSSIDTGHDAMIDAPKVLAKLVQDLTA